MIGAVLASAALAAGPIGEADIGATYRVAEPDALVEMEAAASGKSVGPGDFGDSNRWSATRSRVLPIAEVDRIRDIIPFFTLPFDIPGKDGTILYPKGFTFNPLEHLTLSATLWVVREGELDWALREAKPGDLVILSGGNALKESERRKTPIYLLQDQLADRLSLEAAPSLVWQEGAVLKVQEIAESRVRRAMTEKTTATGGGGQ